jgi:6,7-dimethyl-8-ribityllumazine synthase
VEGTLALRVAIVVARFNDFVTERLLTGAREALAAAGLDPSAIEVHYVPGAFEIPLAAEAVAAAGDIDGVVCLGCLIKGATPHFEYIASACAHGIMAAQSKTGVPMAFGVLTTNSAEEALERAVPGPGNKGREAAEATLAMIALLRDTKGTKAARRARRRHQGHEGHEGHQGGTTRRAGAKADAQGLTGERDE